MTTEDQIKQIQELWNQEAIAGGEGQCCQLYRFEISYILHFALL